LDCLTELRTVALAFRVAGVTRMFSTPNRIALTTALMSRERFLMHQGQVRTGVDRLEMVLGVVDNDLARDAALHRFEGLTDGTWELMRLYLMHQGHKCATDRDMLRHAFLDGLITTSQEADAWGRMREDRQRLGRAHDDDISAGVFDQIRTTYAPLLRTMAGRVEGLTWD